MITMIVESPEEEARSAKYTRRVVYAFGAGWAFLLALSNDHGIFASFFYGLLSWGYVGYYILRNVIEKFS